MTNESAARTAVATLEGWRRAFDEKGHSSLARDCEDITALIISQDQMIRGLEAARANEPTAHATSSIPASAAKRVKHLKQGSTYEVLGEAEAQVTIGADGRPIGLGLVRQRQLTEGDKLVVYRGTDGKLWARFPDEFNDGRFEEIQS